MKLLVSREVQPENSVVRVGEVAFGDGSFVVMAGPCSVESEEQLMQCAQAIAESGGQLLRGGAFKPRTSPYEFQGLGEVGLQLLAKARERFGLGIVTEVMTEADVELVAGYADLMQVGARNMQNFALLKALGRCGKPVLLKRGPAATLKEWMMAAEYVLAHGNPDVVLCERGIRSFDSHTRNVCDIAAVPAMKEMTHLPVILDPSHATGRRSLVAPLSRAAVAIGADGLLVECHPNPDQALSDGAQSLTLEQFRELMMTLPCRAVRA
jgi:3-deoxy-7-phosphoheptulonate synthase